MKIRGCFSGGALHSRIMRWTLMHSQIFVDFISNVLQIEVQYSYEPVFKFLIHLLKMINKTITKRSTPPGVISVFYWKIKSQAKEIITI